MNFSITTLGCKVNQYDGCVLSEALESAGLERLGAGDSTSPVGLVVINTCCITSTAMRKSRQAIRRAIRNAPSAVVAVTGCYSEYDARRISTLLSSLNVPAGRIIITGHHDGPGTSVKQILKVMSACGIATKACTNSSDGQTFNCGLQTGGKVSGKGLSATADNPAFHNILPSNIIARRAAAVKKNISLHTGGCIRSFADHQRAFVKVQDGCDAFCTYCIVPYTRPHVWWRDGDVVVSECRQLVEAGHREIVLCGVFLGAYGRDTTVRKRWGDSASRLAPLLRRVCNIDGLWRVRLSSLEPADVTEELLAACRELPNFAPHLHLPLQSGSDAILRRMNRKYTAQQFTRTVDRARSALDRLAITTDIIVGFPGESDEDFGRTLETARRARFAKIHAFPFSAIEGTPAWEFRHEAPQPDVVKQRTAALAELEEDLAGEFRRQFIGETMEGLVEQPRRQDGGQCRAMTDRYLTVTFAAPPGSSPVELTGSVARVQILWVSSGGLVGQIGQ